MIFNSVSQERESTLDRCTRCYPDLTSPFLPIQRGEPWDSLILLGYRVQKSAMASGALDWEIINIAEGDLNCVRRGGSLIASGRTLVDMMRMMP